MSFGGGFSHPGQDLPYSIHKRVQIGKDDFHDDGPVDTVVIMHKAVPQAGHHVPRLVRVGGFELAAQLVNLLPDVVQRGSDSPLGKLVLQQKLRCDAALLHLAGQVLPGGNDLFQTLFVRLFHAMRTPSCITVL